MNTKMRSEFWKCRECGTVAPIDFNDRIQCCRNGDCGFVASLVVIQETSPELYHPTNVEVLVAWLQASDERRREIEIASRPTEAGMYGFYEYSRAGLSCFSVPCTVLRDMTVVFSEDCAKPLSEIEHGLWEPLT